jgi:MerR family copper efflux transcriptional regulator
MKIGELAKLTNIPASTIRFYESKGLIKPCIDSTNGYRQYTREDLEQLKLIKFSQSLGFSLDEILMLRKPNDELDHRVIIERLIQKQKEANVLITQVQRKSARIALLLGLLDDHWSKGQCLPEHRLLNEVDY